MAEKLLSVIIPTKDREFYCKRVLDYMLSFNDERIEYVVQNNGKSNDLDEYIKEKNDDRIVYRHIYEPLCQVDNSDQSIELSSGQYICFIGDDDIVLPNIMQYVEYAIKNDIDNIAQKNFIGYMWPSEVYPTGELRYSKNCDNTEEVVLNQSKNIETYIRNGCCKNPKDFNLPVLYHGITKRQCVENVKKETGHYVGGSSPDSYTSVSLAKYVKKQVIINNNYSIFGACPQSATRLSQIGGHCGELSDAPQLKNRGVYKWDVMIPKYYSVQTIWAESAITALREIHNPKVNAINLEELFCEAYLRNKTIRKLIVSQTSINLKENNINCLSFWIVSILKLIIKYLYDKFEINTYRIMRLLKLTDIRFVNGVNDISECVKFVLR